MTPEAWMQAGIAVAGYVAMIATVRTKVQGLSARVSKLEKRNERLTEDFVPRRELMAELNAIRGAINDVKGYLSRWAVYSAGRAGQQEDR